MREPHGRHFRKFDIFVQGKKDKKIPSRGGRGEGRTTLATQGK